MPKQYQQVVGKPLLRHSVERFLSHPAIDAVRVVIAADHRADYDKAVDGLSLGEPIVGGKERADSVRLGLEALTADAPDYVLVHDAARPFISHDVIDRLLAALQPERAVVPALPVADTVRRYEAGAWQEIPRAGLLRIQTPQAFPFKALFTLHQKTNAPLTDDAALWLEAGHALEYVAGQETLHKVTTAEDIALANACTAYRMAVGSGYDVHALVPAGEAGVIRLGGVSIAHTHHLHGHSDADVVLHALVDALLGSIAAGDIGSHFPPSDARWKGANSEIFVAEALRLVQAQGGRLEHVDLTIICEAPKIGPHRETMRTRIAAMLGVPVAYVSVKATTTEQLGFTGRREGIAAQASVTVALPRMGEQA